MFAMHCLNSNHLSQLIIITGRFLSIPMLTNSYFFQSKNQKVKKKNIKIQALLFLERTTI